MRDTTTIGDRLVTVRGRRTQSEFADLIGVSANSLRAYEKGRALPNAETLATICGKFSISPAWLLIGQGPMKAGESFTAAATEAVCDVDLIHVPMVEAQLSAGTGSFEVSDNVERRYAFRADFLRRRGQPRSMVLMRVMGDSMEPDIKSEDVVLIDQSQTSPKPGQIFAVGVEDLVYLKMIDALPGRLVLKSYNPAYAPIEVETSGDLADGVRIIGHVIWIGRELK